MSHWYSLVIHQPLAITMFKWTSQFSFSDVFIVTFSFPVSSQEAWWKHKQTMHHWFSFWTDRSEIALAWNTLKSPEAPKIMDLQAFTMWNWKLSDVMPLSCLTDDWHDSDRVLTLQRKLKGAPQAKKHQGSINRLIRIGFWCPANHDGYIRANTTE